MRSELVISRFTKPLVSHNHLFLPQVMEKPFTIPILYVDDEPDLLSLGKIFLELSGDFQVDIALSAKTALDMMRLFDYSVIVSDFQMPEMNGIELFSEIQRIHGNIPFVLFTARGWKEVSSPALNTGRVFYLQKGGNANTQYTALDRVVRDALMSWQD